MNKTCPHCGAPLPEGASFCPNCAESINVRSEPEIPRHTSRRALRGILAAAVIAAVVLGIWAWNRPHSYEGAAEPLYTDKDGSYQLVLPKMADPALPMPEMEYDIQAGEDYRAPALLYVYHKESGANAGEAFRDKIASSEIEFIQPEDAAHPYQWSDPAPHEGAPDAALVSLIDFTTECPSPVQLVWTLHMENGDTIVLRQDWILREIHTYDYHPEDEAMSSSSELQSLVDRLAETTDPLDVVNLYLPAVTYEETLVLHDRPFNLYGAQEGGKTVFTGGIQMRPVKGLGNKVSYFRDIEFIGEGNGVGVSTAGLVWAQDCVFSNWKTGLLSYGNTWTNATDCTFENNGIGLHFNDTDAVPADESFTNNRFSKNGTGVLLEAVPTDLTLIFDGSIFTDNGTDIDNRCDQPLEISNAVFQ